MLAVRHCSLRLTSHQMVAAYSTHQGRAFAPPNYMVPRQGRKTGILIVPQQQAWVVERFGKFARILEPGLNLVWPFVESVAYKHSLKEEAIDIGRQSAITMDNVTIDIDGVLYIKVRNAEKTSYGVEDPRYAVTQLAQTTMRSELGKIPLDNTFRERDSLNARIVEQINAASADWGIEALRYEIRDISPPPSVRNAMDQQAEAERRKRAQILDSEGSMQAAINNAEGLKKATVLQAEGDAEATKVRAAAIAEGVSDVAKSVHKPGGSEAISLRVAEQYIAAFGNLAKEGTTLLLPANASDPSSMVAQAMSIFNKLGSTTKSAPTTTSALANPREKNAEEEEDYEDEEEAHDLNPDEELK